MKILQLATALEEKINDQISLIKKTAKMIKTLERTNKSDDVIQEKYYQLYLEYAELRPIKDFMLWKNPKFRDFIEGLEILWKENNGNT